MHKRSASAELIWLTTAISVPLIFNPWGANTFELPKAALLRALVLLLALATLSEKRPRLRVPPEILRLTLAFALSAAAATLCSTDAHVSLWGSYARQQGLLTLLAYLGLFLLTTHHLRTRRQLMRLWLMLVWSSAPVVLYGLTQGLRIAPPDWQSDAASPVLSTLGRANFLGSYLVLVIPLTAGYTLTNRRRRAATLFLLAGQFLCLLLTLARAAWLGFCAALVTGLLVWARMHRSRRPAWIALALMLLAGSFLALLNLPDGPLAPLAHWPGLDRLATLAATDAGSTAARLTIWRTSLPLIAARPWLGYGPDTLWPAFARVFPPELVFYQGRGITVDRAHNLWLDLGLSVGVAGSVAFGALLFGVGQRIRRGLRAAQTAWERAAWTAITAALVGHLVDLQFSFDLTATATIFWLVLAMSTALSRAPLPTQPLASSHRPRRAWFLLPATLILIGLLSVRPLLADLAYARSQSTTSPTSTRLAAAQRAVRLQPTEPQYRLALAQLALDQGEQATAALALKSAQQLAPDDPELWMGLGACYARWNAEAAASAYRRATELAPTSATYHAALGQFYAQEGHTRAALVELERAAALDVTAPETHRQLAEIYHALGQEAAAEEAQRQADYWARRTAE